MGYRSRQQRSSEFLASVPQPYSPEYKPAMVVVMGDPDACLSERLYTAARYFSWGNSSQHAVSDWDPDKARPLGQNDLGLIIACVEDRMPIQDLTAEKLSAMRQNPDLRPKCMKSKQEISRAFRRNEARGTIRCEGRRIFAVPAPEPVERPKSSHLMTFDKDQEYLATVDPGKLERLAKAEQEAAEIRRDLRAGYREYRKSSNVMTLDPPDTKPEVARDGDSPERNVMTFGADHLITEEEDLRSTSSSSELPLPTTTNGRSNGHAPAPAATEQNSAVLSAPDPVSEALHHWAPGADAIAKESLCRNVREVAADATDDEIVYALNVKGPMVRTKDNPTGFLLTAVPNHFRGVATWRADLRRASRAAAAAQIPRRMTPTDIVDVLNDPVFTEQQKRDMLGDDYRRE